MSRIIRHKRIRAKVRGTKEKPRLSVFRSNKHIFLQLIDDGSGKTLVSESDLKDKKKTTKTEAAKEAGKKLAESAKTKKIKTAVFDRGGYKYHGIIKAVAEGAREGGLKI
jgi:large subunit ribosomal protein L18